MIIRIPMRFEGSKGEKIMYALFDSGATYSCITEELAKHLSNPDPLNKPMRLGTADSTNFMNVTERCILDFYHEDIRMTDEFLLVRGISEEVIIGATTMQKWRLKLDFEHDRVLIDPQIAKLIMIGLREIK